MTAQSAVRVEVVGGRSRIVRSVSQDPLKLIPTRSENVDCCSVVVSNYGGGLVQGDDARLEVTCGTGARLYLGTQALNKVYRCPDTPARQTIVGQVGDNARVASLPDPVMLFEGSRYVQRQVWSVAAGSVLAVADGMVSGRREMGETFAFTSYASETRVDRDGRPTALERFRCEPERLSPDGQAVFGGDHVIASLLVVGADGDACFEKTARTLQTETASVQVEGVTAVYARPKAGVVTLRLIAKRLSLADAPVRRLNGCVARCVLGFDPLTRKA